MKLGLEVFRGFMIEHPQMKSFSLAWVMRCPLLPHIALCRGTFHRGSPGVDLVAPVSFRSEEAPRPPADFMCQCDVTEPVLERRTAVFMSSMRWLEHSSHTIIDLSSYFGRFEHVYLGLMKMPDAYFVFLLEYRVKQIWIIDT